MGVISVLVQKLVCVCVYAVAIVAEHPPNNGQTEQAYPGVRPGTSGF